jgi:hypothetical protein
MLVPQPEISPSHGLLFPTSLSPLLSQLLLKEKRMDACIEVPRIEVKTSSTFDKTEEPEVSTPSKKED